MRRFLSVLTGAVLLLAACGGAAAPARTSASGPSTPADLARYQGADRQQILEAGARKEGSVDWYTVTAGDVISALTDGFSKKYPYIKVDVFRADAAALITRANQEDQAGKPTWT